MTVPAAGDARHTADHREREVLVFVVVVVGVGERRSNSLFQPQRLRPPLLLPLGCCVFAAAAIHLSPSLSRAPSPLLESSPECHSDNNYNTCNMSVSSVCVCVWILTPLFVLTHRGSSSTTSTASRAPRCRTARPSRKSSGTYPLPSSFLSVYPPNPLVRLLVADVVTARMSCRTRDRPRARTSRVFC